jgi:hypothetical protein
MVVLLKKFYYCRASMQIAGGCHWAVTLRFGLIFSTPRSCRSRPIPLGKPVGQLVESPVGGRGRICRFLARTRPTGTSALTSAFEGNSGPDMLGPSSSPFDPELIGATGDCLAFAVENALPSACLPPLWRC